MTVNFSHRLVGDSEQEEIKQRLRALAQAAGMWQDESVRKAIELALMYEDAKRVEFLAHLFQSRIALDDSRTANLIFPDPEDPEEVSLGDIHLGELMCHVAKVGLPSPELLLNVFITGPPRKGKSVKIIQMIEQLIEKKIPVHIFDTQDEYPDVLASLFDGDVLDIIDARDCRINPFDGPAHMSQREWVIGPMCNYLREALYWRDKTIELFRTVCVGLYESGVETITPPMFVEAYKKVPKHKQYLPEFGSLERFATMLRTVPTFHCFHGEQIETVSKKSRVYGLRNLSKDARLFLVSHLVTLHMFSREFKRDRQLEIVFVFDELNQFITKETVTRFVDIGESFFLELLRTSRRMGIGVILADQVYSLVHDVARSNCQTKIILEVRDAPSRRQIARDLGLNPEQEAFLSEMSYGQENRRAVIQLSYYPYPFLMEIPHFERPAPLTPEQMEERRNLAVATMEWEPVPEARTGRNPAPSEETFLEEKELKLLKVIGCNCKLFPSQQEYASKLGMATSTFSKWAGKLKQAGLVKEISINLYNQGAPIKFLYPSDEGYAYLDRLKISYDPIPGDGSIPHRYWQRRIWIKVRRKGDLGGVEYELNGKRADVAVIRPSERQSYEVVFEGTLQKEISNLQKDLKAGFDHVTFCVQDEEVRQSLANLISREVSDSDDRVEIRLLKEFA